jgi:hypothetical protein
MVTLDFMKGTMMGSRRHARARPKGELKWILTPLGGGAAVAQAFSL